MIFYIKSDIIEISAYKTLEKYTDDYPVCRDIIDFLDLWFDDSVAYITFKTSGSTGTPKQIKHLKSAMIKSALLTGEYFSFNKNQNCLLALPVNYISGAMMLVRCLVWDMNLIISQLKTDVFKGVDQMINIDFAPMTTMQFQLAYENNLSRLNQINKILLGGSALTKNQKSLIKDIIPQMYIGYGMTETITHIAVKKLNGIDAAESFTVLNGVMISFNEDNCLVINADHISDTIETHDVVQLIDTKSFVWIGRSDNIINSGGLKINPEAIESEMAYPMLKPFIISAVDDKLLGQKLVVIVETKSLDKSDIHNFKIAISKIGNKAKRPKCITSIPHFHYSPTNKILRKKILESIDNLKSHSIISIDNYE